MEKTKCVRVFIFLQGEKNNKLWFSSKQTNCFPYVSKKKLLFCHSARSMDDSSGGILESSTFSLVAGKMCLPTHGLCSLVIGLGVPTTAPLLKGSQRSRRNRVWFLPAVRAAEQEPSEVWPRGLRMLPFHTLVPVPGVDAGRMLAFCRKMV